MTESKKMDNVLKKVSEADPASREEMLAQECDYDDDMIRRLRELLKANEATNGFEDAQRSPNAAGHQGAVPSENPGTIIGGRYKLRENIGEGGMGSVWVADQLEPVKRCVAIKLIKAGMDSKQVIARFEAERQALAVMDHPNIAKILDGGMTELGRPYFVMEYVKGVPFTQYCDEVRLSLKDRLQLFISVCQAVQHAHHKGIVHRDLKPSNILICLYDGKPIPKVIDFGLAKALNQSLTEQSLYTAHGMLIGTPLYMSPEQAELNNLDIDTRTDIYSLGVVLYELLSGTTPLESQQLKQAAYDEILRLIKEVDPLRPSIRLSGSQSLSSIAALRNIDPRDLRRTLAGELDWIVMKALEKERSRRYETANGLSRDIERYLNEEPVEACPPSRIYLFKKLIRKNKGKVIAATAIFFSMLIGSIGTLLGLLEARSQAKLADSARIEAQSSAREAEEALDRERHQREIAEANLSRARNAEAETKTKVAELAQVTEFQSAQLSNIDVRSMGLRLRQLLIDQFSSSLDRGRLSEEEYAKALEVFSASLAKINFVDISLDTLQANIFEPAQSMVRNDYVDQPIFMAEILHALGTTRQELGILRGTVDLFAEEVDLREKYQGKEHPDTLRAMNALGSILMIEERIQDAERLFRKTLHVRKKSLGDSNGETLSSANNLALSLKHQRKFDEAAQLFNDIIEARVVALGEDHPTTLISKSNMASLHQEMRNEAKAESLYREVYEAMQRVKSETDHDTLTALYNLASFLREVDKFAEAEMLFERGMEMCRRALGNQHPLTLKWVGNFGSLCIALRKYEKAEALCRESYESSRQALGEDNPTTLALFHSLISLNISQRRFQDAEPMLRNLIESRQRILGLEHEDTLNAMNNLAFVLKSQQKLSEAEEVYRKVLESRCDVFGPDDPSTIATRKSLVGLLNSRGKNAETEVYLRDTLATDRRVFGNEHPNTLTSINSLGLLMQSLGRKEEAEAYHREVLDARRRVLGNEDPNTLVSIHNLGSVLQDLKKYDEAEQLFWEAIDGRRRVLGNGHVQTLNTMNSLGLMLRTLGKYDVAEPLLQESLEIRRKSLGNDHLDTLNSINSLGLLFARMKRFEDAESLYREAINGYRQKLVADHPLLLNSIHNLAYLFDSMNRNAEAIEMYRDAFEGRRRKLGLENSDTLNTLAGLSRVLTQEKQFEELSELVLPVAKMGNKPWAIQAVLDACRQVREPREVQELANEIAETCRRRADENPANFADCLRMIGLAFSQISRFQEAESMFREALNKLKTTETEDWQILRLESNLGIALRGLGRNEEANALIVSSYEKLKAIEDKLPANDRWQILNDAQTAYEVVR